MGIKQVASECSRKNATYLVMPIQVKLNGGGADEGVFGIIDQREVTGDPIPNRTDFITIRMPGIGNIGFKEGLEIPGKLPGIDYRGIRFIRQPGHLLKAAPDRLPFFQLSGHEYFQAEIFLFPG